MHTTVLEKISAISLSLLVLLSNAAADELKYSNPVLTGDFPDPSIIRVGDEFWATATTSEWAPLFPLLHSRDLVHWQLEGAVFQKRPDWSYGNYWAPEISEYRGKFFVYYVGHKKGGPLNIAVATAEKPIGPWTDRGPLIGQDAGSIDPMSMLDENGARYLVWKEDGNSRKQPTPIWAQKLSDDGTKLVGEMKELIRNDVAWEGDLVEGPFVLRRGEWFYLFYSGGACCGRACSYGVGVARAKNLLGPWQKNPANPILMGNEKFRCPGHGSLVTDKNGRTFFLYHAYDAKDFVYVGRQGMLDEVKWNADGWPVINNGRGPSSSAPAPLEFSAVTDRRYSEFTDEFTSVKLNPRWQWPQSNEPVVHLKNHELILSPNREHAKDLLGAVLAAQTTSGNYIAITSIDFREIKTNTAAGLFAFGDKNNALGLVVQNGKIRLLRRQDNHDSILASSDLPHVEKISLWLSVRDGHLFRFAAKTGDWKSTGGDWKSIGSDADLEGNYLPPWDRGVRIALTAGGGENAAAKFQELKIVSPEPR